MPHQYSGLFDSARVILYHKQSTSAMTRFFRFNNAGVVVGGALPDLAAAVAAGPERAVVAHPGSIAAELERWLNLQAGDLEVDSDYRELVEVPGNLLHVHLIRFTTIDPPFMQAEQANGSFISLTQARGLSPVELELLRSAYTHIMEG